MNTIEQLKQDKLNLESEISKMINEFSQKHENLNLSSELKSKNFQVDRVDGYSERFYEYSFKINVEL